LDLRRGARSEMSGQKYSIGQWADLVRGDVGTRVLGVDYGRRRIGLAISDATRTLARPLTTLTVTGPAHGVSQVVGEIVRLAAEEDGLAAIVVGLPTRLDGSPNDETPRVLAFIDALAAKTPLPIARVDERLTSHEANARLSVGERDWRRRKERLDAAAAAVLLQDYLDLEPRGAGGA
jgi:putative Holliday junction resolvase